jgi:hypothetical protein
LGDLVFVRPFDGTLSLSRARGHNWINTVTLPDVAQGTFYVYRLFEVAEEVNLGKVGELSLPPSIQVRPGRLTFFGRLRTMLSVAALGPKDVEVEPGKWLQADCTVLLFSFGVAAACFQFVIGKSDGVTSIASTLSAKDAASLVSKFNGSTELTRVGKGLVERVLSLVTRALDRPIDYPEYETYTLLQIQGFTSPIAIDDALRSADLGRILLGESATFEPAPSFLSQLTSHNYRYGVDDVCVIDWDTAVTIDPSPTEDIPDLLALALTQLLEFQRYDTILERELNTLYEWTAGRSRGENWLRQGRASRRVDLVNRLLIDINDFVDRTQNAFKITEDVHYARIYRGAIERFQVPAWRSSVLGRQQAVAELSRTLYDRAQLSVAHFLEIIIILLISFEIVYAFFD